uniref:Uncharacterized protein n=1 Tax=Piliocolobus tephrosceles TaxID=591936 RepID=A0A8C9HNB6_9PRIM
MCSTCKNADAFNLSSKSLIWKLEAGPRNLYFELVSLIILMKIVYRPYFEKFCCLGNMQRTTVPLLLSISSFSLTSFPLPISQSMHYSLS